MGEKRLSGGRLLLFWGGVVLLAGAFALGEAGCGTAPLPVVPNGEGQDRPSEGLLYGGGANMSSAPVPAAASALANH